MESAAAANLPDQCLIRLREGYAVELLRFFRLRNIKGSLREIFLYERDYSGQDAVWAGLTTAQSGKLEASAKLFDSKNTWISGHNCTDRIPKAETSSCWFGRNYPDPLVRHHYPDWQQDFVASAIFANFAGKQ
jgi:hypothetical protein